MTRPHQTHSTGADLLALHTLRCIGFASLERVAAASGLPEPEAESELIDLAVAGLVTRLAGEFGGWGLTEAGRVFLALNPELLDLCAAWQLRSVDGSRP